MIAEDDAYDSNYSDEEPDVSEDDEPMSSGGKVSPDSIPDLPMEQSSDRVNTGNHSPNDLKFIHTREAHAQLIDATPTSKDAGCDASLEFTSIEQENESADERRRTHLEQAQGLAN